MERLASPATGRRLRCVGPATGTDETVELRLRGEFLADLDERWPEERDNSRSRSCEGPRLMWCMERARQSGSSKTYRRANGSTTSFTERDSAVSRARWVSLPRLALLDLVQIGEIHHVRRRNLPFIRFLREL